MKHRTCRLALAAPAVLTVLVLATVSVSAQHGGGHHAPAAPVQAQPQPYSGLQARPVKALSDRQIADLRAGRGMGLALPAELNGYPGPMHVLELADRLALTDAQRARMQALYEAMKAEAVPIGERLIAQETDLDGRFASRTITPAALAAATDAIGATQGQLRAAHLRYHLLTAEALTLDQVRAYAVLRGYAGGHAGGAHGGEHGQP
jgi:hypothetical protein